MIVERLQEKTINDYNVTITVDIPAENKDIVEIELWDILKSLNQLPYQFETEIREVGKWL